MKNIENNKIIRDFLIINCTGKNDSIALKVDNKFFFKKIQTNLVKNEMLAFLKENNVKIDNKFSLIVNSGPGSFSGVRIALSVAKGIQLVNKVNIFTYNYFLLNVAPHLNKKKKIISIQKTNNFYYYSDCNFRNYYTFTVPQKITSDFLDKEDSTIVVPEEIINDEIFNNINLKKIKIAQYNLKNIEMLIENNLLENKLIKPLYLS